MRPQLRVPSKYLQRSCENDPPDEDCQAHGLKLGRSRNQV